MRAGGHRQAAGAVELYLDTCASEHCFKDMALFRGLLRPCGPVEVANKERVSAAGVGRAVVQLRCSAGEEWEASFDDVRCCEDFAANLVSWPRLKAKGFKLLEDAAGVLFVIQEPLDPGKLNYDSQLGIYTRDFGSSSRSTKIRI